MSPQGARAVGLGPSAALCGACVRPAPRTGARALGVWSAGDSAVRFVTTGCHFCVPGSLPQSVVTSRPLTCCDRGRPAAVRVTKSATSLCQPPPPKGPLCPWPELRGWPRGCRGWWRQRGRPPVRAARGGRPRAAPCPCSSPAGGVRAATCALTRHPAAEQGCRVPTPHRAPCGQPAASASCLRPHVSAQQALVSEAPSALGS